MTLAFHGKLRRRQAALIALAVVAVVAALGFATSRPNRRAWAASYALAPASASCFDNANTDDDDGVTGSRSCDAAGPLALLGTTESDAANRSSMVNLEDDQFTTGDGDSDSKGTDVLTVGFDLSGFSAAAIVSVELRIWAFTSDATAVVPVGVTGNIGKYGSAFPDSPHTYVDSDLLADALVAAGTATPLSIQVRALCSPDLTPDCGALIDKVELVVVDDAPDAPATRTLVIEKSSDNGAIPTDWTMTIEADSALADTSDDLASGPASAQATVDVGTPYHIKESGPDYWQPVGVSCDGGSELLLNSSASSRFITLSEEDDEIVTCTFVNEPTPRLLTVTKAVEGNDADPVNWTLFIKDESGSTLNWGGGGASWPLTVGETYTIGESGGLFGFRLKDITCTGAGFLLEKNLDAGTASLTPGFPGAEIDCTVTNEPRLITLQKSNANGITPEDWWLTIDLDNAVSGAGSVSMPAQAGETYSLREMYQGSVGEQDSFLMGEPVCQLEDGTSVASSPHEESALAVEGWYQVTVPEGRQDVICTFTNEPIIHNLTVCKVILDPAGDYTDGQDAPAADFSIVIGDPDQVVAHTVEFDLPLTGSVLLDGEEEVPADCETIPMLQGSWKYWAEQGLTDDWEAPEYSDLNDGDSFCAYSTSGPDNCNGRILLDNDRLLLVLNRYKGEEPATIWNAKVVINHQADSHTFEALVEEAGGDGSNDYTASFTQQSPHSQEVPAGAYGSTEQGPVPGYDFIETLGFYEWNWEGDLPVCPPYEPQQEALTLGGNLAVLAQTEGYPVEPGNEILFCHYNVAVGTVTVQKIDESDRLDGPFVVDVRDQFDKPVDGLDPFPNGGGSQAIAVDAGERVYSIAGETVDGQPLPLGPTICRRDPEASYFTIALVSADASVSFAGDEVQLIITNHDCAVEAQGNLRVFKWYDTDGDGAWDGDEEPIEGWKVAISGPEYPSGVEKATNAAGRVDIDGITAGTYVVAEEQRGGWQQTGLVVTVASQPVPTALGPTVAVEVKDSADNPEDPDSVVEFGNRELATVVVTKTVDDRVGTRGVGGWHINLAGCGTSITRVTDATGTAAFNNLLPADNCAYTVTEVDSEGFAVSYPGGQVVAPGAGDEATVTVHNNRVPTVTALDTPTPTPTSTPVTPTATPTEEPGETVTTEPEPTETVAGERTPGPGSLATPIAPEAGTGFAGSGTGASMALAALGLMVATSGLLFVALGRRRV